MKARIGYLCLVASCFLMASCGGGNTSEKVRDTPTSGTITISIDESLRPLVAAEKDTFEGLYDQAHLKTIYTSEDSAIAAVINDSARVAFVTRHLNKQEEQAFKKLTIIPRQLEIANEGVALIINKQNSDSLITFDQLKMILEGKITKWIQISGKSNLGELEVVFDNPQSGIIRFLSDSVSKIEKLPKNFYAVKSNPLVIDYVSKKANAIGFIGVSWISDKDDPASNKFLQSIRVVGVSKDDRYFKPYQAYIASWQYPLRRKITAITRETRIALGNGFLSFVAGDKGQRIVLKSGMVPATMPLRIVSFKKKKLSD
jgi:phosphate transport system substrate-binding protein